MVLWHFLLILLMSFKAGIKKLNKSFSTGVKLRLMCHFYRVQKLLQGQDCIEFEFEWILKGSQ